MHAEVLKNFIKDKDHSDEVLNTLFKVHGVQVISTMACVTDLDHESLLELAADEQTFKELLEAVLLVNQAYFKYEKPKRGIKRKMTPLGLIHSSFWYQWVINIVRSWKCPTAHSKAMLRRQTRCTNRVSLTLLLLRVLLNPTKRL